MDNTNTVCTRCECRFVQGDSELCPSCEQLAYYEEREEMEYMSECLDHDDKEDIVEIHGPLDYDPLPEGFEDDILAEQALIDANLENYVFCVFQTVFHEWDRPAQIMNICKNQDKAQQLMDQYISNDEHGQFAYEVKMIQVEY